jgi:hypothetical protein
MRRLLYLVALALLCSNLSVFAQQGTTEVRGVVTDSQGAVLPGATVEVKNQDTGMYRSTVTNQDGTYFVSGIVPGRYQITASLEGFKTYSQRDISLSLGKTAAVDLRLQVGNVSESVTVTGESPLVDVTSKEVGGNITSRELTDLPSINRNYIGFVGLLPGIVANVSTESFGSDSINVNGQDARNNNYLLDGSNNNDDVIGQRAGTQARTPLEAIQEFQVLTNQFDAEFGRTTGAVINAVTKQGTNQLRGSAFTFIQDAELTTRDFFAKQNDLPKPDTKQQWYGGTIGGPLVKDKAHFFFSLERVLIDEGVTVNVPARPEFNATTTEKTRVWNTLIRFDHQLNSANTWGVRWLREYSPQFNQIIDDPPRTATLPARREEDDTDQTVVGSLSSVLSNTRVNTLRLAFTQEDVAFANPCFNGHGRDQLPCSPRLNYLTYLDGDSSVAQARVNNAYQVENTFSWFVPGKGGDHDLKFGLQFQYVSADSDTQDNMNGTFTFRTNSPFNAADPSTYPERLQIRVPGASSFLLTARYFSGFAQDKWRLNDRLTLSVGTRYDLEVIPFSEQGTGGIGAVGKAPKDTNNFSPRIGFSYDLSGGGRSALRGGYGLFFDKTHFELITALLTSGFLSNSFIANFPANAADPGPGAGRLPTDSMLVGGPVVNRDLLNQQYPPGATVANAGTIFVDSPDRRVPYTHQFTFGYERQIGPTMSANVDYVRAIGRDQFMTKDLNAGLRANTSRTGTIVRPITQYRNQIINQRLNAGETDYDALQMQFEKRFASGWSSRVAYTLSYSRGNTSGNGIPTSPFQLLDDMRLDLDQGPTDFDRRHNLVISGSLLVPRTHGMTVSWVARALSGLPFTIQDTTTDPDQNGTLFDPLAAGSYTGSGANSYSSDSDGGRNGARGPGFVQLDTRFGWRLNMGSGRTLDVFGEVFNLTNRANFANPTGDRFSTNFMRLTGLREGAVPRTGQIGIRVGF